MHDLVAMRVVEGVGHFEGDPHRDVYGELSLVRQAVTQGLSLHHRHDEPEKPVDLTGVVQRQDVGMREPCR